MNNKSTFFSFFTSRIAACLLLVLFAFCAKQGQGQTLAAWANSWSGVSASPFNATTLGTNVSSAQLIRSGSLASVSSSARFNSSGWSASNFLTITITPTGGSVLNLNGKTVVVTMGSSGTGPNAYTLYSSVDNYSASLGALATSCSSSSSTTVTLPSTGFNGLASITFKITGVQTGCSGTFGAGGTGGPASITINGNAVVTASSTITVNASSLTNFNYTQGSGPSAEQSFTITSTGLTAPLVITPPADYIISTSSGVESNSTISLPATTTSATIYVKLKAGLTTGVYNESIPVTSTGVTSTQAAAVSGSVTAATPTINITGSPLSGFTYVQSSGPSGEQSFLISGANLTSNLLIAPPSSGDFIISTTSGAESNSTINLGTGNISSTTIFVKLKSGLTAGSYNSESITASSISATSQTAVASGTVSVPLAFTSGNIAVLVTPASVSNTTASVVELNPATANGAAVTTFNIDAVNPVTAMRFSGSASSTGYLANTNDGTLLSFTGGDTTNTTVNINTVINRGVGTLNGNYIFNLATSYKGASGNQTRCATSTDNSTWYVGDQNGIYTNSATAPSPLGNFRATKSFGGVVYGCTTTTTLAPVGILSAPTGGSYTSLPGLPLASSTIQDFYLVSSGANGNSYDVLYLLSTKSGTKDTLYKYSLVGGSWVLNGAGYLTTFGGFSLVAQASNGGANLYITSGDGAVVANTVVKLFDAAGYNLPIAITTANNVVLYTASATANIKGIAFAPLPFFTSASTSLTAFNYSAGSGPSAAQSFILSGTFLLPYASGNITINGSADYEVSTTSATAGFGTTATIAYANGIFSNATIWVRLKAGLVAGNYNNETISITGGNVSPAFNITASGTVTACTAPAVGAITPSPASQTLCTGATPLNLVVSATGTGTLTYQWYSNTVNNNTSGTSVGISNGGTTNTYTPSTTSVGTIYYYCIVSSGTCNTASPTETVIVTAPVVPAFSIATNFCTGNAPALPTTSTNGITGTWNPSTVNNTTGGTYIFTPGTGQCGINDTLTTTVNPRPAATFSSSPGNSVCAQTDITYTTQSGMSNYQWNIVATEGIDYIITAGGTGLSDSTVTLQWLTTGTQIVSINYSNGCPSTSANSVTTVNPLPLLTTDITMLIQTVCSGSAITNLSVAASGTGLSYQWYSNTTNTTTGGISLGTNNGGQTSIYTPQSATVGTTYYYCVITGTGTCSIYSSIARVTITADAWVGTSDSDWNNALNWCGIIPTVTTDVIIPSGTTQPIVSTTSYVNNITLASGSSLIVNGTFHIHGTITNNGGLFDATAGSIEMAGSSAQSIGGNMFVSSTINNLIDSNTNTTTGLSVNNNDTVNITGQLKFDYPASILTTNNAVALVSNASGTASVAPIMEDANGNAKSTINGNVIVQRYFIDHRRWRLITAPVQSPGPTISSSWQEGGQSVAGSISNPSPGFGAHITGPTVGAFVQSTGYDQSISNSASIAWLTGATAWYALSTTFVPVTSYQGFMIFIRGGRDYPIFTSTSLTPATNATLRTTGKLNIGVQNIPVNNGFTVIGNPYASTINFNNVFSKTATQAALGGTALNNTFYLWDPNIASADNVANGTGGWVTLTTDGAGGYVAAPDPTDGAFPHPFDINGDIQSGAAFIVNGVGTGSIQIDESDKVVGSSNNGTYLYRHAASPATMLRTTLYATSADSTRKLMYLADGVLNIFGENYSNNVDLSEDVQKQLNLNEKCSILKSGTLLSTERSVPVTAGDSIVFNLSGLKKSNYRFDFIAKNFNRPDLAAILIDSATHNVTPIHLGDSTTTLNFSVTADSATFAKNRFYILFRSVPKNPPPPVVVDTNKVSSNNGIVIYPNPVTNGTVHLQLNNLPAGNYGLNVLSTAGKTVLSKIISYAGENDVQIITLDKAIANGIYILQVVHPDGTITKINFEKQ